MTDLTGKFHCNDNGDYWVRQVGDDIYWFGRARGEPPGFSNVFIGRMSGDHFDGRWGDVPMGGTRNEGEIHLHVEGNDFFRRINATGGFGGSEWRRE